MIKQETQSIGEAFHHHHHRAYHTKYSWHRLLLRVWAGLHLCRAEFRAKHHHLHHRQDSNIGEKQHLQTEARYWTNAGKGGCRCKNSGSGQRTR